MSGYFELLTAKDGQFYFNLKAGNHEVILTSEMYTNRAAAECGIFSVQENSQDETKFERKTSSNNKPYFVLKAKNHQEIGRSEMYDSKAAFENGISSVMSCGNTQEIRDKTENSTVGFESYTVDGAKTGVRYSKEQLEPSMTKQDKDPIEQEDLEHAIDVFKTMCKRWTQTKYKVTIDQYAQKTILNALTALQSLKSVDVGKLKQERYQAYDNLYDSRTKNVTWGDGWEDCVNYCHEQGHLTPASKPEKDRVMAMMADALKYTGEMLKIKGTGTAHLEPYKQALKAYAELTGGDGNE